MATPTPQDVLRFWFEESSPKQWWAKDATFDAQIAARFGALHQQAVQGKLAAWRATAQGRLAEIIVLDQFSRNLYRNDARAFAADALAVRYAQEAVEEGADQQLSADQRYFLYMPLMHSESQAVHEQAMELFEKLGQADALDYEKKHKAIIDRFGRYPHRNAVLQRKSTAEEIAFLKEPNSSF